MKVGDRVKVVHTWPQSAEPPYMGEEATVMSLSEPIYGSHGAYMIVKVEGPNINWVFYDHELEVIG